MPQVWHTQESREITYMSFESEIAKLTCILEKKKANSQAVCRQGHCRAVLQMLVIYTQGLSLLFWIYPLHMPYARVATRLNFQPQAVSKQEPFRRFA